MATGIQMTRTARHSRGKNREQQDTAAGAATGHLHSLHCVLLFLLVGFLVVVGRCCDQRLDFGIFDFDLNKDSKNQSLIGTPREKQR